MASFDWGVFRILGEKLAPNIHSKTKNQKDTTEICSLSKSKKKLFQHLINILPEIGFRSSPLRLNVKPLFKKTQTLINHPGVN